MVENLIENGLELIESTRKENGKPLDIREQNFIIEYLTEPSFNPEKAAIKAGYSKTTARSKSSIWVGNSRQNPKPYIKGIIDKILENTIEGSGITMKKILEETRNIAFSNVADIYQIMTNDGVSIDDFKGLPREVTSCIESFEQKIDKNGEITVKFKFYNKLAALAQLGKHLTMKKDSTPIEKKLTVVRSLIEYDENKNAIDKVKF